MGQTNSVSADIKCSRVVRWKKHVHSDLQSDTKHGAADYQNDSLHSGSKRLFSRMLDHMYVFQLVIPQQYQSLRPRKKATYAAVCMVNAVPRAILLTIVP
jgi:hypothetical protein